MPQMGSIDFGQLVGPREGITSLTAVGLGPWAPGMHHESTFGIPKTPSNGDSMTTESLVQHTAQLSVGNRIRSPNCTLDKVVAPNAPPPTTATKSPNTNGSRGHLTADTPAQELDHPLGDPTPLFLRPFPTPRHCNTLIFTRK
jgi:hypothetical protein